MRANPATRLFAAFALSAWFAAAAPTVLCAQTAKPGALRAPRARPSAGQPAADGDGAKRMWWNREQIASRLELDAEQRSAMDQRFEARIGERRQSARKAALLRREMSEALVAGDWDTASDLAQQMSAAMTEATESDNALVIDVVKLLSAEQRKRLADNYPRVLQRPWLVGGFVGR